MIDRYIAPALTFAMLIAGHVAIAMALFATPSTQSANQLAKAAPVIQLEAVVVTAKRVS